MATWLKDEQVRLDRIVKGLELKVEVARAYDWTSHETNELEERLRNAEIDASAYYELREVYHA